MILMASEDHIRWCEEISLYRIGYSDHKRLNIDHSCVNWATLGLTDNNHVYGATFNYSWMPL